MLPVLFSIGHYEVYSYGLMLAVAFIVGIILVSKEAPRQGLDEDAIFNLSLLVIIAGLIGARAGFVLQNLKHFLDHPQEIWLVQEGGLSIHGGLFLAILAGWLYTRRRRLSFGRVANLMAPAIALGTAIARIGCFLNGCCYGKEALPPWGISIGGGLPVYPVQLWESGLSFLLFLGLWKYRQNRKSGQLFLLYLAGYSLIRFCIEFWRWGQPVLLGFTLAQLVSLGMLIVSASLLIRQADHHDVSRGI